METNPAEETVRRWVRDEAKLLKVQVARVPPTSSELESGSYRLTAVLVVLLALAFITAVVVNMNAMQRCAWACGAPGMDKWTEHTYVNGVVGPETCTCKVTP